MKWTSWNNQKERDKKKIIRKWTRKINNERTLLICSSTPYDIHLSLAIFDWFLFVVTQMPRKNPSRRWISVEWLPRQPLLLLSIISASLQHRTMTRSTAAWPKIKSSIWKPSRVERQSAPPLWSLLEGFWRFNGRQRFGAVDMIWNRSRDLG